MILSMTRIALVVLASAAVAAPSAAASPVKKWQKTYHTTCVTVAPPSDPIRQGCQVQTIEHVELDIGQSIGQSATSGASALTIAVTPSHAQCATVQIQSMGSYKRHGISDHQEYPVDYDLSQGRTLTLDQPDWFTGVWLLQVMITVNVPSNGCASAPAVTDGDTFTLKLSSPAQPRPDRRRRDAQPASSGDRGLLRLERGRAHRDPRHRAGARGETVRVRTQELRHDKALRRLALRIQA